MMRLVVLLSALLVAAPAFPAAEELGPRALVDALHQGGYIIYFRHAHTDRTTRDVDRENLENCATQRLLSDEGRRQSRAIGEAFRTLAIPVGDVLASPYCRTLETARLAFGDARPVPALRHLHPEDQRNAERVARGLRPLLAAVPEAGRNTVIVAHGFNFRALLRLQLAEGEAAIIRPDGEGGHALIGRLRSGTLAAEAAAQ